MQKPSSSSSRKVFFETSTESSKSFWTQKSLDYFAKAIKLLEHPFYIKTPDASPQWQNCTLLLYGSFLVCRMKDASFLEYINLEDTFYRLETFRFYKKDDQCELSGFSLHKNGLQVELLCKKNSVFQMWIDHLSSQCVLTNFHSKYKVIDELGSGGYGQVFLVEEISTKVRRAAKFIKIQPLKTREKQQMMVKNEITCLRKLNHRNIVKLYEVYELHNDIVLVMEYAKGERLFDTIIRGVGLSELETSSIMKQLFTVLSHLRSKDIVHRDFKPENIIVTQINNEKQIKLLDFGLATFSTKQGEHRKGGTAGYIAPEIFNGEPCSFKTDVYSVGVVMYTCLTGKPLFAANSYSQLLAKNKKGIPKFSSTNWSRVSRLGRELLQKMVEAHPSKRYSLDEVFEHPWLESYMTPQERAEFFESTLRFIQVEIPKEGEVSEIPTSRGEIPYFDRTPSFSNIETNTCSIASLTAVPSQSKDPQLDSFYKIQTKDSDISERSSQEFENSHSDCKINMLGLPQKKLKLIPQKGASQLSLGSRQDFESYNFGNYSIQIHGIGSFADIDHVPSEDEIPCSELYTKLEPIPLFFPKKGKITQSASNKIGKMVQKESNRLHIG